ncbi:MAG: transketolase C-terminal domain-containing protein [Bacteroidota bacterium]
MRTEFAQTMVQCASHYPESVFLTGDLGYMALEKVQEAFQNRFINAGVAEQNMISVAAGLAHEGFIPWVYSIAPFVTLRPYEQIRNDVCLHDLPVKLVGNGGGYGYGIMGGTHHVLEDIGAMRILPHMQVYVPFVSSDVAEAVQHMMSDPHPGYLRLNLGARIPQTIESFSPWRRVTSGTKAVVIGTGPVVEHVLKLEPSLVEMLDVWIVSKFPLESLPELLIEVISKLKNVITIEEHYGQCGLGETCAAEILYSIFLPLRYHSLYATGYPSGSYGSQQWHQAENNLAGEGLQRKIREFLQ